MYSLMWLGGKRWALRLVFFKHRRLERLVRLDEHATEMCLTLGGDMRMVI